VSHLIVIGILRNIVPNLVVRQSFDVVVVVVLQDVEDLSALSEEVILDHSGELNGTKAKNCFVHKIERAKASVVVVRYRT